MEPKSSVYFEYAGRLEQSAALHFMFVWKIHSRRHTCVHLLLKVFLADRLNVVSSSTLAWQGCPPSSLVRKTSNRKKAPDTGFSKGHAGFISDTKAASDLCKHPQLLEQHDDLIAPKPRPINSSLFPLFGDAKTSINLDIRLPISDFSSLTSAEIVGFDTSGKPWSNKDDVLLWRGSPEADCGNWNTSHRLRFVRMINHTEVQARMNDSMEQFSGNIPQSFTTPGLQDLPHFLQAHTNVSFTQRDCRNEGSSEGCCADLLNEIDLAPEISLQEQTNAKFVAVLDGTSNVDGLFRNLLLSSSVPVRATIYRSWSDSRLIPWKHYIPMSNTFQDLYGILDFFFRDETDLSRSHQKDFKKRALQSKYDQMAKEIANSGSEWARKVLRKADMEIYVFRLLIEYGRLLNGTEAS
jgi:hypothetical protein